MNIITAIGNPNINEELKKLKGIEIISKDIQYKDGILEVLEINNNINYIFLNENLPGNISLIKLIEKIKLINNKIKIIIILEKLEEDFKKYLLLKKIKFVYKEELNLNKILELINYKNKSNNLLNKNLFNNNLITNENNNLNNKLEITINNFKNKLLNSKNLINNKIIIIEGYTGAGKTVVATLLAYFNKNKTLLINTNKYNNIYSILCINKKNEKSNKIIEAKKELDLLLIENEKIEQFKNEIEKIKNNYNLILIDSEKNNKLIKNYLYNLADEIIFLSEPNLFGISKSLNYIKYILNQQKINQEKISIIFNKYNKNSIDYELLKNIFGEYNVLGKINSNYIYDKIINKNINLLNTNLKIKNEYISILNKL